MSPMEEVITLAMLKSVFLYLAIGIFFFLLIGFMTSLIMINNRSRKSRVIVPFLVVMVVLSLLVFCAYLRPDVVVGWLYG